MAEIATPDFGADTPDAFRATVREWLLVNFPPSLRGKSISKSAPRPTKYIGGTRSFDRR